MKILIFYEYPPRDWSVSIQGSLLHRGLVENGVDCKACYYMAKKEDKEWYYKAFKPDIILGMGCWIDAPTIIQDPIKLGFQPVPWLLADGWIANYHNVLSNLPLVFTTSSWVIDTYKRDGVDVKNYEVLHVGFDSKEFKPIPKSDPIVKEVRKMFGAKEGEKIILTMGGDVTSKGAQEMIQALSKIDREYHNYKYVCIAGADEGARNHHEEEMALIHQLGLDPNKVLYLEQEFHHDFIPYLLNACDIYAAPSRLEGFGMIQLEAMACGIPVISIDAMGPKDTIVHGKTGFLAKIAKTIDLEEEWTTKEMGFPEPFKMKFNQPKTLAYRADTDDLARFTLDLLVDDNLRKKIGEQAAQHALDNFQYQNLANRCANLLREKLNLS